MSMSQGSENQLQQRVAEYPYEGCSCWPYRNRAGGLFWGLALLLVGAIWLANNIFDIGNWGEWLVPILFVTWGAVLLAGVRTGRRDSHRTR
jgi:fatty acid desaturase